MKRLFIILTFMISSFFLFSVNNVMADTIYSVNETDFNYINEDFLKLRELAIEYCNTNNTDYLIIYENSKYVALFIDKSFTTSLKDAWPSNILFSSTGSFDRYYLDNSAIVFEKSDTSISNILLNSGVLQYYYYLDTNIEIAYTGSKSFTIQYSDLSYSVESGGNIPTLYQIYLDDNVVVDEHASEKEIIGNFYNTIISKIGYLTENFSSNYIYLSVIGVFILIFIIELIFRRFI